MNTIKILFATFILILAGTLVSQAQVQLDRQLQMIGSGDSSRITGIDSVSESTDAVNVDALQRGKFIYAEATGSSGNYEVNLSPVITKLQPGMVIRFKANHDTPGAATLTVNGGSQIPLKKNVSSAIASGDIKDEQMVSVIFDGSNFQVISQLASSGGGGGGSDNTLIYTTNGF